MLDLILGGILCFISTYIGITGKLYYDKRYRFLKDFVAFLQDLKDNMVYSKDNLISIAAKFVQQNKGDICKALVLYKEILAKGENTEKNIKDIFDYKYLKKGERAFVNEFFLTLGTLDYDNQIAKVNLTMVQAEKLRDKAEKDSKTTGAVLSKLGLLAGIAIMLIMA